VIPEDATGTILEGEDCSKVGGDPYTLAEAVRDAVSDSSYDTLIDVEVTNTTGLLVWSNCLRVRGKALRSESLDGPGDAR
jgi:hypothetical protein